MEYYFMRSAYLLGNFYMLNCVAMSGMRWISDFDITGPRP